MIDFFLPARFFSVLFFTVLLSSENFLQWNFGTVAKGEKAQNINYVTYQFLMQVKSATLKQIIDFIFEKFTL